MEITKGIRMVQLKKMVSHKGSRKYTKGLSSLMHILQKHVLLPFLRSVLCSFFLAVMVLGCCRPLTHAGILELKE